MSWTQDDLDALRGAIAKGVTKLRNAQGEEVTYRSMDEMMRLRAEMERQLAPKASVRQHYPTYSRGTR